MQTASRQIAFISEKDFSTIFCGQSHCSFLPVRSLVMGVIKVLMYVCFRVHVGKILLAVNKREKLQSGQFKLITCSEVSCEKIGLGANNLWRSMKGFRNKNLSVITFLFYLKDAKAFTQNWLCYMCVSNRRAYGTLHEKLPRATRSRDRAQR